MITIDDLYETALAKLTQQDQILPLSEKLKGLTTNEERVLYVFEILKDLNSFPIAVEVTKTDNVSTYYRNQGNKSFQNKDDYRAWQYYNLSLLHAPTDTENYCTALANRSAVFYSLKKYKECLQDIKEVFSLNYPEKLKEKLLKRQTLCKENVTNSNVDTDHGCLCRINHLLTLPTTHERYPCASTKLEVVFNEIMGRHVIAKEYINVGEVLVQEEPYFALLLKSQLLFSCSFCLSRSLNLLPCSYCCFSLYCSSKCQEQAWKDYHSIECVLMATLIAMDFTKLEHLALRTVIKARNDSGDWKSLFESIEVAEKNAKTDLCGHVKVDETWVYDSKYYASIHTLASNIEKRNVSDIFQKSVTAAVFLHFLSDNTEFLKSDDVLEAKNIRKCVAGILLLHIMTSPTNMHGLNSMIETSHGDYVEDISLASAPYAFHSLLNHSCSPNVVRCTKLGTSHMTLYALRPIKKGSQLYDNYGAHHALQSRDSRRKSLMFQYKFFCCCEACINNWPTYGAMTSSGRSDICQYKENLLNKKVLEGLQQGDKGTAYRLYKPLCELIEVLHPFSPCTELADCEESLKQCLFIFQGLVPYGYSNLVDWDAVPPEV